MWTAAAGPAQVDVYRLKRDKYEIDVANDVERRTYTAATLPQAIAVARHKLAQYAYAVANPLFGFGSQVTYSSRLHGTGRNSDAYKAGRASGDTDAFGAWWKRATEGAKFSSGAKRQAQAQYRAGVASLWAEEKREAKQQKVAAGRTAKAERGGVEDDVIDGLVGQGMSKTEARAKVRRAYRQGDSFSDLWHRVMARARSTNPAAMRRLVGSRTFREAGPTQRAALLTFGGGR
jgi:hypothetical protein